MKKLSLITPFFVVLFIFFNTADVGADQWKARWKFGTLAPDGVGWARQIKDIVLPAVEKATENTLSIKVYWGGVMGDDEDYIKKMRIGQLHGAGWSGQGVTLGIPEMAVVELPFLFNDYGEVDFIKKKMSETFDQIAKKNGYMMIAWIDEDFCRVYSTKYDLSEVRQYADAKVLSWFGPIEAEVLKALSANSISVNMPEAPPALRQGVGDTIIAASIWVLGTQLYSTVKYVTPYALRYSPAMIAVSWDAWETMPRQYKKNYYGVRDDVMTRFCTEVRKDNKKSLKAMLEYGMMEKSVSKTEFDLLRQKTRPIWDEAADKLYPAELLEELLDYLEEYREK